MIERLEYVDDSHTYLFDGVIVPSVTQILAVMFGGKYDRVDRQTLDAAAKRGTAIHKAIEDHCTKGENDGSKEVRNFDFLLRSHKLKVVENEIPVVIQKDDFTAAGRLDLILESDGLCVADIKTTSAIDREYLGYQLNLYRIGYQQTYGKEIKRLYGVHLRGDTRKLYSIPINEELAWDIVAQYRKENE